MTVLDAAKAFLAKVGQWRARQMPLDPWYVYVYVYMYNNIYIDILYIYIYVYRAATGFT